MLRICPPPRGTESLQRRLHRKSARRSMETGVYRYSGVSACDGPNIALRFLGNDAADPPISCDADDAHEDCWQQLEAFWGAEKHRCTHESPAFESSTESQLESRDFLSEPPKPPARVGSTLLAPGIGENFGESPASVRLAHQPDLCFTATPPPSTRTSTPTCPPPPPPHRTIF